MSDSDDHGAGSPRLTARRNDGSSSSHKAWLASTLQGTPEEQAQTLASVRQIVQAMALAEHVATWTVAYVLRQEFRASSELLYTGPEYNDTTEMLSDNPKGRHAGAIFKLFDEAIHFALLGHVYGEAPGEPTNKRAGSGQRFECRQLLQTHSLRFRELWPFTPTSVIVPASTRHAAAERWSSAYITSIQERLYDTLMWVINTITRRKDAYASRKRKSNKLVALAKSRLASISAYKSWIDTDDRAEPDLSDPAIRRLHDLLGPLLRQYGRPLVGASERRQARAASSSSASAHPMSKSLRMRISAEPGRFLGLYLATMHLIATTPELALKARPLALPLARSFVPRHQLFDAAALMSLHDMSEVDGDDADRAAARWQAFSRTFNLQARPFSSATADGERRDCRWTLNASILTDGYAISVHKCRTDFKQDDSKAGKKAQRKRRYARTRGTGAAQKAAARRGDIGPSFPELGTLADEDVIAAEGRSVFVDVGKHNLLFCVSERSVKHDFGYGSFRYTVGSRHRGLGIKMHALRLAQHERNLSPDLRAVLEDFRSTKKPKEGGFADSEIEWWIKAKARISGPFTQIYAAPLYRTQRLLAFSRSQRETARLTSTLSRKFGGNAVFFVGDWRGNKIPGLPSTWKGSQIQRLLHKSGFTVYTLDEFRTSKYCPICFGRVEHSTSVRHQSRAARKRGPAVGLAT
ncbi:hypothetical protein OC842_003353 [Tilletia horrida]|uniref:Uncharacterized protein n=1 Tax=Tilletia horrida TaxID=155126 RepID=A0AAN6JKH9_9BASI|nr:hypothetical protein OC842_003353 [Tilletia horrida]